MRAADLVWRLVRAIRRREHRSWRRASVLVERRERLGFLNDVSDRVELEDREHCGHMLVAGSARGIAALGEDWVSKLSADILQHLGRYRRYKGDEVRDSCG